MITHFVIVPKCPLDATESLFNPSTHFNPPKWLRATGLEGSLRVEIPSKAWDCCGQARAKSRKLDYNLSCARHVRGDCIRRCVSVMESKGLEMRENKGIGSELAIHEYP